MLQVEGFDEVERAFVHVDYERREEPEHKVCVLPLAAFLAHTRAHRRQVQAIDAILKPFTL